MTKRGGRRKRTKSQASPNSVDPQPDKQVRMADKSPPFSSTQVFQQSPTYSQQTPSYTGPYMAPHLQFTPLQSTQTPPPPPAPVTPIAGLESIMQRFDTIDRRLCKLDSIETQVSQLSQKMTAIDTKVTSLEHDLHEQKRKIADLESSRTFDTEQCNSLKSKHSDIETLLKNEKSRNSEMAKNLKSLEAENKRMSEEMLDLQSRSMRDNLLFFNFDEHMNRDERAREDCISKITEFMESTLMIPDAKAIKIDRAHRVGGFNSGKKRPIIAKFNFHQDKLRVKQVAFEKLKDTTYRVSDQYPKPIQDRRKKLIPHMIKAKHEGKTAYLSYDKLYVNGTQYTADSFPDA